MPRWPRCAKWPSNTAMSNQAAWALAQLVAGLNPAGLNPQRWRGQYAEAWAIYSSANGNGPKALHSWLVMPGHEQIKAAAFAHKPGTPMPPAEAQAYNLTDLGNGERIADQHATQLRYVPQWDWMAYTNGRWQRNPASAARAAKVMVRRIYAEAQAIEDDKARKELVAWAIKSESATRVDAALKMAQSELALMAQAHEFDSDPYALNCTNGILDLRTGKIRPHDPKELHTRMAGTHYEPKAQCPAWLRFLDVVFEGDKDLIAFVQRAIGYTLTGDTGEQVLFFLHGTGRNGKTTLLEVVRAMLADYGQQTEAATFLQRQGDSIRNDIARLAGVRFAAAIEVGEGRRLNEALVKSVTGQDTITARFLHKEFFEFVPAFKLWLAANHKPTIKGTDEAIWRRMRLVPFEVTIPRADVDRHLKAKLLAELPGVLAWAVRGCLDWQKGGLCEPAAVRNATKAYRAEMDVIAQFIDEMCLVGQEARCTANELYKAYKRWCEANNEQPENQRGFGTKLSERDFERGRSNGVHIWQGLGLLDHERAES